MNKHDRIITYLYEHQQWIDSQSLSNALAIPKRSLLRYISDLNHQYTDIILSSKKGYCINFESYAVYQQNKQSEENRIQVIIHRLCFDMHPISIEDLADELYISLTTLQRDLKNVKKILAHYAIDLLYTSNTVFINGSEKSKRLLIKEYTYGEVNKGFTDIYSLQQYFPTYNTQKIKDIIADELTRNHLFADDFVLYSLTLHILIKMERTKANYNLSPDHTSNTKLNSVFQIISRNICKLITQLSKIDFTQTEVIEFGILISSLIHEPEKNSNDMTSMISSELFQITATIVQLVNENYGLDLNTSSFINSFALHLKNMFLRLEHHIAIKNPLLMKLKTQYPFIYEISIFIANTLIENHGTISEDEIAYIALHLGSHVDETQSYSTKVNCIVISPEFYSLNKKLIKTITSRYNEQLIITNVLSSFRELERNNCADLIISTIPAPFDYADKTVCINLLVDQADLQKLDMNIYAALKAKTVHKFQDKIKVFFHPEHFLIVDEILSSDWIINKLSESLVQEGYVTDDFALACLKREEISPTTYNEIAIPHPIAVQPNKSVIGAAINKQYFLWNNDTKVKLVLLLAINREDLEAFRLIFEFISYYANENGELKKITNADTFDEFLMSLNIYIDQMLNKK